MACRTSKAASRSSGVHAKNKPLAETVDVDGLARKTYGFSGAQLADLLNEAAILAARRGGEAIEPEDVHGGWLKVAVGTARRRSMDERERSIIAAHEVGHAICGRIHGDKRRVEEISLFAHGDALGVTVSSQEDNDLPSETDLRARLVALMGGRAAEELLFQEVTGGASNDFEKANSIATQMVTRWGMGVDPEAKEAGISGRGSLSFLVARANGSLPTDVQASATRAIRGILDDAYAEACGTLVEHIDTLRRIAAYLFEQERIDGETFDALFDGQLDVPNAAIEWRAPAARPRAWTDIEPYLERRRARQAPDAPTPDEPGRDAADGEDGGRADELPVAAAVGLPLGEAEPAGFVHIGRRRAPADRGGRAGAAAGEHLARPVGSRPRAIGSRAIGSRAIGSGGRTLDGDCEGSRCRRSSAPRTGFSRTRRTPRAEVPSLVAMLLPRGRISRGSTTRAARPTLSTVAGRHVRSRSSSRSPRQGIDRRWGSVVGGGARCRRTTGEGAR